MLPSSLSAHLVVLVAYVAAVPAVPAVSNAPSLTVKTWASNTNVDGVEPLEVTMAIANTGGETLGLLNDPRGVMDPFPKNTFTITDPPGSRPSFSGVKTHYNSTHAASLDDPGAFTVLPPGDFIDSTHDPPATYNLSQSGAGDYFIKPLEHFTHADADEAPKDLYATVGAAAKVKLISNLAVFPVYDKRGDIAVSSIRDEQGRFRGCSPGRQARILSACRAAQTLAHNAHTYLQGISIGTPQYSTWFGAYDAARKATVESHFEKIDGTEFSSYTYDCTCKRPNMYAYVNIYRPGRINICPIFWELDLVGEDSQAGGLIHEASHFLESGSTEDITFGKSNCTGLGNRDPAKAITNADNYKYFAENPCIGPSCVIS